MSLNWEKEKKKRYNCVKNNRATPDGLHWEKVE